MSKIHHLKSWPQFFSELRNGTRTHELRRNDRAFSVGDLLILHEFDFELRDYTGAQCEVEVTSMTSFSQPCAVSGEALNPNVCILSVRLAKSRERQGKATEYSSSSKTNLEQATT